MSMAAFQYPYCRTVKQAKYGLSKLQHTVSNAACQNATASDSILMDKG